MIKIENFLANENSEILNYKFDQDKIYFLNMKENDINNFWSFLTENKNFVLGELIVEDTLITSNVSSKIRRTVLDEYTFFVDTGLWYRKKTTSFKLLKELANFKNTKKEFLERYYNLLEAFGVDEFTYEKPYYKLSLYERIVLDLILMIIVEKTYNFYLLPEWNQLDNALKKLIINKLQNISTQVRQVFIFVTSQTDPNLLDINNKELKVSNEITMFSKEFKKVQPRKRNSFKSFMNLSKIILSMFRLPYTISMIVMFACLFVIMLMVYSADNILKFDEAKYVIWTGLITIFVMLGGFVGWCVPYFETYKQFVKTQPIPSSSKITYFCYTNLILISTILFIANLSSWLISELLYKPTMSNIYVSYGIFINLGFLIINLVLLALWILLYNKNNFKQSLRR